MQFLFHRRRGQKNIGELLLHHACSVLCLGLCAHTGKLLGFASVALLVEVNSVFLHVRQLCLMSGMTKARHV